MIDLIRRALWWARRQFVPVPRPEQARGAAEPRAAKETAPPSPRARLPWWHAELRHIEETALVRLYVVAEDERARLRLEPRWRPLAAGLPRTVAEVH
ncbi:hypothetical protein ACSNOH_20265 [Streptomyces sp. URMC 127]|uniref:hypothetical protein n=1 Tax=Streptomyces sp. URMC 127 TaxID=3423402 RepID=UPI003F1C395A